MPNQSKPGVDWLEIKRRYLGGESISNLTKVYPVSRQAVHKRGRKEGWLLPDSVRTPLAAVTLQDSHAMWKARPEKLGEYLKCLTEGMNKGLAAKACGLSRPTILRWRDSNRDFDAACEAATAHWARGRIENINKAGDRGDWRADSWLLERHPETRGDFQGPKSEGGASIHVVLNIPVPKLPGDDAKLIEGKVEDE
jgi:transposase